MKPSRSLLFKLTQFSAFIIIMVGFALRLHGLAEESLWYDELLQLDIAQSPLPWLLPRLRGHAALPLDYLISHFWLELGRNDGWVRLPAVLVGTATLPVAYQLGRRLLGSGEGLLVMTLLALSPFHIRYSQEVRPYALVVLGVALAGYAFWRFRQIGHWRYWFFLQAGVLIFSLAHLFALTLLGVLFVFAVIDLAFNQNRKQAARSFTALLATTLLPLAILVWIGWGRTLFYTSKDLGEALVEPQKSGAEASQKIDKGAGPEVNWSFIKYEVLAPLGGGSADISLWVFNLLAGLGLLYLFVQKKYKLGLLLLLWLVLPIVIIISFLVLRGTFFAPRYVILILPAYLMLLATGMLALPRWLKCAEPWWLSIWIFLLISGSVFMDSTADLIRLYQDKNKENWRLVGEFITQNAQPAEAIIAMRAEPVMNWYYPPAWTAPNYFWDLETIQETVEKSDRSWVILSLFSAGVDVEVQEWLSQQGAIPFTLDPIITVYYVGAKATREQLLAEVRTFALPVNHALYASLAEENLHEPEVARRYYELAIRHAPSDEIRAKYEQAILALPQR